MIRPFIRRSGFRLAWIVLLLAVPALACSRDTAATEDLSLLFQTDTVTARPASPTARKSPQLTSANTAPVYPSDRGAVEYFSQHSHVAAARHTAAGGVFRSGRRHAPDGRHTVRRPAIRHPLGGQFSASAGQFADARPSADHSRLAGRHLGFQASFSRQRDCLLAHVRPLRPDTVHQRSKRVSGIL